MDSRGSIAHFETDADAEIAGYLRKIKDAALLAALSKMPRAERVAAFDHATGVPGMPHTSTVRRNRKAAKAARGARRANRRG